MSSSTVILNSPGASPSDAALRLRELVDSSGGRWRRWMLLEGVALAVGLPLAYLWLVFALDNLLHLPVWGRMAANVIFFVVTLWLLASLVRRRNRLHLTEDQVALAMERRTAGGVQNRLINALQISREARLADAGFGQAVVEENYLSLQKLVLQQAGQLRPAVLRVAFAGVMVAVGLLFWAFQPALFQNAAARIMLPLADVDPVYRTHLAIEPGDVEGAGDIAIRVRISGNIPDQMTLFRIVDGRRTTETIPVARGRADAEYVIRGVTRTTQYAVRGGDVTSPYYRITVPTASSLTGINATFKYPAYTRWPDKTVRSAGGDLEALAGTTAHLAFAFDHDPDAAAMLVQKVAAAATQPARDGAGGAAVTVVTVPLQKVGPKEFAGDITFDGVFGYQLQTRQGSRPPHVSGHYALNVRADQEPSLQLAGLDKRTEADPDAVFPVTLEASDDIGLRTTGIYTRKVSASSPAATRTSDDGWQAVQVWPAAGEMQVRKDFRLSVAALGGVEGDVFEVAPRGGDTHPARIAALTTGSSHTLMVGGEDAALQVLYEQILRTEAALRALIDSQEEAMAQASAWMVKLAPASGLKWDDPKNADALVKAVSAMAAGQTKIHDASGAAARQMVAEAGNLRISLGMLADTEMVRAIRIIEAVPARDTPQAKRAALADAKMTQERTIRSLTEIAEAHTRFRRDWELANMIPFVKMLADRQAALRDASAKAAAQPSSESDANRHRSAANRQEKVANLCATARAAFVALSERLKKDEPTMGTAFAAAATSLTADEIKVAMAQAAKSLAAGHWADAVPRQDVAAKALAAIHQQLQAAKLTAAKEALAALQEKAKSDLEAQKEFERLRAGHTENKLAGVDESKLKLAEIIHIKDVTAGKKEAKEQEAKENLYKLENENSSALQQPDKGMRQQFKNLKLATTPDGPAPRFPNQSDRASNTVKPHVQEEFEDLVGKLLEEADDLQKKYDTFNINMAANIDEAGDVGKQGGDLNSTAAAAATGNQKPPPNDQGGISRQGRMGGRAHGMVMGDQGVNRRGRDKVQEAQERIPDQPGTIKQSPSEDEQKDISTGVGGKKAETDKETTFNTSDKGKFTDDMAKRMGKVAKKNAIVERQDGKIDPRIADMLKDLNGTQEQVIERLKVIRKELKNLYLPTDKVDEALADLTKNLAALEERPAADIFRLQSQTLDKLRGALTVFTQHGSGFQPSLPRDQAVRGRVLDEPARPPLPGYEDAVKTYYELLVK